ncbi:MAG: hypothetical protein ACP5JC_00850 [Candidatus Micrarchaeia archaeon]
MKLNLKKIGAIVAGATILASSVAFAGLMYGNTELVNDNGQPLFKVIVGEKAAASDGVGGAKIVAKGANNAYATKTLKASAKATCTGGNATGTNATGTCEVSRETTTLEVTVPGLGTGVHDFGLLIADYMDKEVKNRWEPGDEWDEYDDLLDTDANVYANQNGTYLLEPVSDLDYFYKISGDNFVPFSRVTVRAGAGRTSNWDEYQFAWVHGNTPRNDDKVDVNIHGGGYSVVFGPDEYGLPLCPGEEDQTYDHVSKPCKDTSDSIEAYRMQIKFLGDTWVISEVSIPSNSDVIAPSDDQTVYEIPTSKVKLAKEATYGIIDVGHCLTWEEKGVKVCLDDISTQVGAENEHPAIVSFTDLKGNIITSADGNPIKDQISPGETEKIYVPGYGEIKVHVYQTAPGYGLLAKWAEMAIYADEITLEDGKKFKGVGGKESDYWRVAIGFTVKSGGKKEQANHLKELMLYDDNGLDEDLTEGESYPIIDLAEYNAYELVYRELEKTGITFDTLQYQTTINKQLSNVYPSGGGSPIPLTFNGTEVKTGINNGFKLSSYKGDRFYVIMDSNESASGYDIGDIIIKDNDGNWYWVDNTGGVIAVEYAQAGNNGYILAYNDGNIMLVEDAGKYQNGDIVDGMDVYMDYDGSNLYLYSVGGEDDEITFYTGEESEANDLLSNPNINFNQLGYANGSDYETGKFISLRGTTVKDGKTKRQFKVPNKVRQVLLRFQPTAQAGVNPDTFTCERIPEGGTCNVGQVSILVKSIDEVVAPCSVAGADACTVASVNAQIVDENNQAMGETVTASVPYTLTSDLMYLDTEATGLNTGVVITVGGQAVNTVTAAALEEAGMTIDSTNNVVVKEVGNKIIVAGYTAEDTLTAVDQFLSGVRRQ